MLGFGDVDGPERLIARSPEAHRRDGINLRMRTEVEEIDLAAGRVTAHDRAAGRSYGEGFDSLVIATGAVPVRPPLPGVDAAGVFGVQTLDDGAALLADLDRARPRRAVVVGGGYIGVEMAEALVRHGVAVTVVDQDAQPMTTLDPDMGPAVHRAMEGIGIDVRTDTAVTGFEAGGDGRICAAAVTRGYHMLALPRHATQARVGAEWLLHALAGGGELIRLGFLAQRTGTLADFEHTNAGLNQEETKAALTAAGEI